MRLLFIGTGEIGVPAFRHLLTRPGITVVGVVTQPDRPAGRRRELKASPVKLAAMEAGVPLLQPEKIRTAESIDSLRLLEPDLAVCMAYGQILPESVLTIPRHGCWNLHASLLPRHRGAAPIQSAIMAGDSETGITVMQMDAGLDTGDMLWKESTAIEPEETAGELHDRLAEVARDALAAALDRFERGELIPTPQDESRATYAPKLSVDSGRIDWTEPSQSLSRTIRAMAPWPGAWSQLELTPGSVRKVKLHRAVVDTMQGEPGAILAADEKGLVVGCGMGSLRLTQLQMEGRRDLPVAEFVRGAGLTPTSRFQMPERRSS